MKLRSSAVLAAARDGTTGEDRFVVRGSLFVVRTRPRKTTNNERRTTNEVFRYVNAEKGQAPKSHEGTHAREGFARTEPRLRRVWTEDIGSRLDHRSPERSGSYRNDAPHQTRRQDLDQNVSG